MGLPLSLLDVEVADGAVRPRFLGRHDERWIGAVLGVLEDLAGERARAAEDAFRGPVLGIGRAFEVEPRTLALLFRLEQGRWTRRVDAPVPPSQLRDVVFDLAATLPRDEALREAGRTLGASPEAIERSLFADRKAERVLVPPATPSTPPGAVLRFNHALAGALLERASRVSAILAGDVRFLAERAKRSGLVVTFAPGDGGVRMDVSGPLALFHATTKYGRALARLVPLLVATRAWSLSADVVLGGTTARLELDATAPLGDVPVPRAPPFAIARRLARDLAREASPWRVVPAHETLRVDGRIFYPDLALEGPCRVLVEVLPRTPEAIVREVRRALDASPVPVVLCVEDARGIERVLGFGASGISARALAAAADDASSSSSRRAR